MNARNVRVLTLLALTGVAACGETLVPGELTEAEAMDMAGAVLVATFASTQAPPTQPGLAAVEFEWTADFDQTVECPLGGSVAIMSDVLVSGETESEMTRLDYTMTQTHNSCVVESEGGHEFTLSGNPDLALNLVVEIDGMESVIEWGGDVEGTIDWQTEGKEGSCAVSFDFGGGLEGQSTSVSGTMGGSVCGVQFERSFSIGGVVGAS